MYAFNVITADRRVYLQALKDFSDTRHTAAFLTSKTIKVIDDIGSDKVAALVTDNAANIKKVRTEVRVKYPQIVSLRYMPHFINLITEDIIKHEWAVSSIKTFQSIVTYFGRHHRPNALLTECRSDGEPQLSSYVKTRWYSAGTCILSVLQNENATSHEAELSANIRAIIANRQFWADCQHIVTCLLYTSPSPRDRTRSRMPSSA